MIFWTAFAVFIAGGGVVASVLTPPSTVGHIKAHAPQTNMALVEVEADALAPIDSPVADRAPASAEPLFSALTIDDKGTQAVDFSLPCQGNGRFAKTVVQVRLSGTACDTHGKPTRNEIESSEIRNTTNGFSATVFYPKSGSFTTDYMTLASGENHIRILHILKTGGRLERDLVIERQTN